MELTVPAIQKSSTIMLIGQLTPREHEVMRLLCGSGSNSEIASRLGITPGTLEVHINRIYSKLGVGSGQRHIAINRYMATLTPADRAALADQIFVLPEGWAVQSF
jgi:DNA-binding CsgD family transcriptional regulator